jgi:peptidoglycan/LPS O-acetylase OafA/YrhL
MKHVNDRGSSRMASLDLLRLIAALSVVLFHYCFRGEVVGDVDAGCPAAAHLPSSAISASIYFS